VEDQLQWAVGNISLVTGQPTVPVS
jgi:hypothetical protein